MKRNKALLLLNLLDKQERKAFSSFIRGHKRKTLHRLYTFLTSPGNIQPGTAAIFKATFKWAYSKKENYLLRNEFRLMSQELIRFVSKQTTNPSNQDEQATQLKSYLRFLLSRNAFDLFESETAHALREAEKKKNFALALYLTKEYFAFVKWHKEATLKTYQDNLSLIDDALYMLKKDFSQQYNSLWIERMFVQRTLKAINPEKNITPFSAPHLDWETFSREDNYLAFTNKVIEAATLSGEKKIQVLKSAVHIMKGVIKPDFDPVLEEARLNASIALEYFLLGENHKSLLFHEKVMAEKPNIPRKQFVPFLFNYLSTLLRVKEYERAIIIINEQGKQWLKNSRLKDRTLCMKAMCHIFLHQPEEAFACIPANLKDSGIDHYYYYRVILLIIYFLRGEFALALTEADNILHSLHYKAYDDDYKKLVLLMKNFFKIQQEKKTLRKDQYLKQLASSGKSLQEFLTSKPNPHNALLYSWMQQTIHQQAI